MMRRHGWGLERLTTAASPERAAGLAGHGRSLEATSLACDHACAECFVCLARRF